MLENGVLKTFSEVAHIAVNYSGYNELIMFSLPH